MAAVIVGGALTPGYRHVANAISELIQAGAPAKPMLDRFFVLYNLLLIGAWRPLSPPRFSRR